MADDPGDDALRQMAEHRGLKLLKSRRRKPGIGDYGKFGLTDPSGKPLLGIADDGLSASPQDIENFLRTDALGTWQQSASALPERPPSKAKTPAPEAARASKPATPKVRTKPAPPPVEPAKPPPVPVLMLRPAKPADAPAIAAMLSQLHGVVIDGGAALRNMEAMQNAGGGLSLATLEKPIGCCGWAVVPTVHRGMIGRITVLFVDQGHRRRGIASQLIAAAEQALSAKDCSTVEVMSDIQIDNAHNFFRALKFEQTSYRFARKLGSA